MVREFDDQLGEDAQESKKKQKESGDSSALAFGMGTESLDTEQVSSDVGPSALPSLGTESLDTEQVSSDVGPSSLSPLGTESLDTEQVSSDYPGVSGISESLETESVSNLDEPFTSIGTTEHVPQDELELLATESSAPAEEIPMLSEVPGSSGADFSASGAPTQQIEEFSDDTEIVQSSSPADAGLDDEVEEVLVLLPESDSTEFGSTLDSETVSSDEYQGDFSQVANAGLRTVNPHSDGAEEDLYGAEEDYEAEYGAEDENVGVIDEIAALASSLDEDILSAEDAPDAGAGHYESEQPVGEFDPDAVYHEFDAPRKSRSGLVLTVLTLAAMVALGVVFYPSLIEKFRTPSASSTSVANASNTGTDPGTGSVDPLETPPDGGSDGADGGSGPIEDPGASPIDDNNVMVAIRHSVAISMEHGVRWKD